MVLLSAYALAVIGNAVFSYFRTLYMTKTGHAIVRDMRYAAFTRLQKLAFDYYDSRPSGKILVRVTNYLDELAGVFSNSVMMLIVDFAKILIIAAWLFIIDSRCHRAYGDMYSAYPQNVVAPSQSIPQQAQ